MEKDPVQRMVDSIAKVTKDVRGQYHLTLGDLISKLKEVDPVSHIYLHNPRSYRGYYCDLAFERCEEPRTVGEFLKEVEEGVLDKELVGYKGGDFLMDKGTPLWVAPYGEASDVAIMGITVDTGDVIISTKKLEE